MLNQLLTYSDQKIAQVQVMSLLEYVFQVPEHVLSEYAFALSSFIAYENRMKFNQLRRLRVSQKSLPIWEKREEILEILQNVSFCGNSLRTKNFVKC